MRHGRVGDAEPVEEGEEVGRSGGHGTLIHARSAVGWSGVSGSGELGLLPSPPGGGGRGGGERVPMNRFECPLKLCSMPPPYPSPASGGGNAASTRRQRASSKRARVTSALMPALAPA